MPRQRWRGQEGAPSGKNDKAKGNDSAGCDEHAPTNGGNDDDGEDGSPTPVNIEEGGEIEGGHIANDATGNKQDDSHDIVCFKSKEYKHEMYSYFDTLWQNTYSNSSVEIFVWALLDNGAIPKIILCLCT